MMTCCSLSTWNRRILLTTTLLFFTKGAAIPLSEGVPRTLPGPTPVPPPGKCPQRTYGGDSGEIRSPQISVNASIYPVATSCWYDIQLPHIDRSKVVRIDFTYFVLEWFYDFVEVYDDQQLIVRLTGNNIDSWPGRTFFSSSGRMSVYFHSDLAKTEMGFVGRWSSAEPFATSTYPPLITSTLNYCVSSTLWTPQCYRFFNVSLSWYGAETYCKNYCANLVTITSEYLNSDVLGDPQVTHNCAALDMNSGEWVSRWCTDQMPFVCHKPSDRWCENL